MDSTELDMSFGRTLKRDQIKAALGLEWTTVAKLQQVTGLGESSVRNALAVLQVMNECTSKTIGRRKLYIARRPLHVVMRNWIRTPELDQAVNEIELNRRLAAVERLRITRRSRRRVR